MQLDLTQPGALTSAAVAELLGSKDDSQHRQLRVSMSGIAYLSDEVGASSLDDVLFRFETWDMGNDYVGAAAAQDPEWVEKIRKALEANWPKPSSSYLDSF